VFILYLGQITQPPTVTVGQVGTQGNAPLIATDVLDNGHRDALLSTEKKKRLGTFSEVLV
jgi:hypothetical protein